jgi:hypothetical protein
VKITIKSEFRINLNNDIMKNSVTQRVIEVLESKNITPNALADKLGMYQQTISKQLREDGSGVSLTTVVGMLELFPDLSAEWLLRGEGSMEKGAKAVQMQFGNVLNNTLVQTIDSLNTTIAMLKERLQAYEQPKKVSDAV